MPPRLDVLPDVPLRAMRLISASLPVGSFAYSRGLEYAAKAGWVRDAEGVEAWIFGTLRHSFAALDGALFLRMMTALDEGDVEAFLEFDAWLAAGRESLELQLEDRRTAAALSTLQADLGAAASVPRGERPNTFAGAFALAAQELAIAPEAALCGLMWGTCDAQAAAAIRLGLMGQTDGQRLLASAPEHLAAALSAARDAEDDEIGAVSFLQALASAAHETQEVRLFRS